MMIWMGCNCACSMLVMINGRKGSYRKYYLIVCAIVDYVLWYSVSRISVFVLGET